MGDGDQVAFTTRVELEKYQFTIAQVKLLLEVELDDTPAMLNHYFNENLKKG